MTAVTVQLHRSSTYASAADGSTAFVARPTRAGQKSAETLRATNMPLSDGSAVPNVTFKCRVRDDSIGGDNPFIFKDVTSADLMAGKRIVLFAVRST